ncbi:MAG: hypothetical protein AB3N20_15430 [Rhizobiaceae bacterium]
MVIAAFPLRDRFFGARSGRVLGPIEGLSVAVGLGDVSINTEFFAVLPKNREERKPFPMTNLDSHYFSIAYRYNDALSCQSQKQEVQSLATGQSVSEFGRIKLIFERLSMAGNGRIA